MAPKVNSLYYFFSFSNQNNIPVNKLPHVFQTAELTMCREQVGETAQMRLKHCEKEVKGEVKSAALLLRSVVAVSFFFLLLIYFQSN